MSKVVLGHAEAHEKLTARMFWKRNGESGYNDAGNVREYVDATTRSLVTRARSEYGARYVNDEQADVTHEAYTFLLDERDAENEKLLNVGRSLADEEQNAVDGATATLTSVVNGKWYPIGAQNIVNVSVNGSVAGALDEGTDYELDGEAGRLRVIPDAGVADGEDLTLSFDQPAIDYQKFESQYDALFYGQFILEEYNQYSRHWLRKKTFNGYLNVMEFPSQTGESGTFRVKVTPSGPVTTLKRPTSETLPTLTEVTEAAGLSSSSSSSNSSSSGHSSSSSSS